MAVKLAGAFLLIFATGSAGYVAARVLDERVILLRRLQGLLQYLATEIDFALTPFPEALTRAGKSLGPEIRAFCSRVLAGLNEGKPLTEAWEEATTFLVTESSLRPKDAEPLRALAPVLGLSDRKDQLRHLELALAQLRHLEHEAESEAIRNQKLFRYAGVLTGLLLVMLFI